MNQEKEKILINTGKEYYYSGIDEFNKSRYNSALVLFFKALISFSDLYILQKTGNTPSSHTERFSITKENFFEVYNLLDKDFPFYQSSYIQKISKELAEVVKNDAEIMAKEAKAEL